MQARGFRAVTAVAAIAATVAAASACGGGGGGESSGQVAQNATFPAGTTMAALNKAGTVAVGTKFDQPLFGLKGLDGKPQGFDVEIAKIVAGGLGIPADKIQWVETPSKVREEAIEQGRVSFVVATYTINNERRKRVTFAGPYYEAGQDIMVKKGNPKGITGPQSLKPTGARVCSVTGSTPAENIKKYVAASQLVLFDVYSKCADALRTGQVDAVTTDNVILLGLIDQNQGQFELVGKRFTKEPYGIGLKKGDVAFCEFIDDTLRKAAADGRYQKAWQDTAGKVATEPVRLPRLEPCS